MNGYWASSWPLWINAFCVIAVYTYLFKDNALYRVMMQIFIGINLGYQAIVQWCDVLYPQWWLPMIDGFRALFGGPGSPWGVLWALVGGIGLLFYCQLSRKYASLSKVAIGITIGIGAGLTFKAQFGQNMPQVVDSFKALAAPVVRSAPKELFTMPGCDYAPTFDGSLAFFVSGVSVSAAETMTGTRLWTTKLPYPPVGGVSVSGETLTVLCAGLSVELDRSTGRFLGNKVSSPVPANPPTPADARTALAVYLKPEFANGVELRSQGDTVEAVVVRDQVAEGLNVGDPVWQVRLSEPIVAVRSFDGLAMVSGHKVTEVWEMPSPRPKLGLSDYFDNWLFVVTVVAVMTYFFFSFKQKGRTFSSVSQVGRWMLMICFGAFFGNTVMTRMSYLVDRLMFLIDDWLRPFFHHFFR